MLIRDIIFDGIKIIYIKYIKCILNLCVFRFGGRILERVKFFLNNIGCKMNDMLFFVGKWSLVVLGLKFMG